MGEGGQSTGQGCQRVKRVHCGGRKVVLCASSGTGELWCAPF